MRVALCTDGIHPFAMGGMQRHSRLLAEHLAQQPGIELVVLHPHSKVFDPELGIIEVCITDIDRDRTYLSELAAYSERVARELRNIKPDVILSQGFCVWKDIQAFSDRLVVMPHGLEMFQGLTWKDRMLTWPFRRAMKYIVRHSAVVVSLGGKLTPILEGLAHGSRCRVVVIPNATDLPPSHHTPHTSHRTPHTSPLHLLFVGRFAFNKGIDVLMEVAWRLVKDGRTDLVRFQLAGDGPMMQTYRDAGLPPNVALLGKVKDDELDRLYRGCDALVLPTRFEGMPTVALEAMARSKPVIVSDVGACAELVDMHNGYLLQPGDADALLAAVLSFAERPREVHLKMGEVSRQRVEEHFTWNAVTGRFVEVMRTFNAAPPRAGAR